MVVGIHKELQVSAELLMAVVVEALDGRFLDGAVHPLDLTVGPGMIHLGQLVLDVVLIADPVEDVLDVPDVLLTRSELHTVVSQHGVDAVGDGLDQVAQEVGRLRLSSALDETDKDEFAGAIDSDEEPQLAFGCADLSQIDVEVADGISGEALLGWLVAADLGQAADAMALQAAVQGRAGQMRDGGLQGVEAVIQRQQGVQSKGDDDGLLLKRQDGRARLLRSHAGVRGG